MTSTLPLLDGTVRSSPGFRDMVGAHPTMVQLFQDITRAAPLDVPILIQGPTGSGKELVAHALHALSKRHGPMVAVNVAAIPEQLAESELFGSVRGAYTGAVTDRKGVVASASGGTLYLDEATELSSLLQLRLLRVLETGRVRALGASRDQTVGFRLVLSTQRPAAELIAAGLWRPDFYYRVAGLTLRVPPLVERSTDIPLLIDRFLGFSGRPGLGIPYSEVRLRHTWPGNVRELRRVVERACFSAGESAVTSAHLRGAIDALQPKPFSGPTLPRRPRSLRELEREHIVETLRETEGNARLAASILGLSRSQLYRRLQALDIQPPLRAANREYATAGRASARPGPSGHPDCPAQAVSTQSLPTSHCEA